MMVEKESRNPRREDLQLLACRAGGFSIYTNVQLDQSIKHATIIALQKGREMTSTLPVYSPRVFPAITFDGRVCRCPKMDQALARSPSVYIV